MVQAAIVWVSAEKKDADRVKKSLVLLRTKNKQDAVSFGFPLSRANHATKHSENATALAVDFAS